MRTIKTAPKVGKVPRDRIQKAVKKVSRDRNKGSDIASTLVLLPLLVAWGALLVNFIRGFR